MHANMQGKAEEAYSPVETLAFASPSDSASLLLSVIISFAFHPAKPSHDCN